MTLPKTVQQAIAQRPLLSPEFYPASNPEDPILNIAAWVSATEAEGPGKRFALWVQGCPLRCPGCCNPHLLEYRAANPMAVSAISAQIATVATRIEGVTFIGGEPFAQAAGLAELGRRVRADGLSVMVFSGFTLEELQAAQRPDWESLLAITDLLVDGPYQRERHTTRRRWIGSENQRVHFLTDRYRHLAPEIEGWSPERNTLEIRFTKGQMTINGFPHPDLTRALLRQKRHPGEEERGQS